jgi:hypothetical protein
VLKKLLVLAAIGGLVYWFVRNRLGGEPDEFVFTEVPADEVGTEPHGDAAPAPPEEGGQAPEAGPPPPTV